MKPTFVIGDVHGHLDRLASLLEQAGIVRETAPGEWERVNHDVEVVQLGDLGHFGKTGSRTGDLMSWEYAYDWIDVVLWGNHDRYVFDRGHAFSGAERPYEDTVRAMVRMVDEGRVLWALSRHGHLLTHAGLHQQFVNNAAPIDKTNPDDVAQWLNGFIGDEDDGHRNAIRNAISRNRGGWSPYGGILWRDISEKLYLDNFPQVFGHSASRDHTVRYCWTNGNSRKIENVPNDTLNVGYCIDIGGKGEWAGDECLAGMWLPTGEVVRVDL